MNVRAILTLPGGILQPRSRCGCAVCSIIPGHLNAPQAVLDLRSRRVPGRIASAVLAVFAATCASPTKPGPPVVELAVQSVSPSTGPAAGGTELTIRGAGFAAGTAVTIGGRTATEISVRGSDTITARTPSSTTAGAVDLAVTLNGRTSTLAGGFRYEVASNTAPVITSIVAQGKRVGQPANFADYGETITVTAVVEDAQTNPALLTYTWHACGGAFAGTGRQVEWQTPATGASATTCMVELIVSDGPRVVARTLPVRLHNSSAEIGALALRFLEEFADSNLPADLVVRDFSDSCKGKSEEQGQIAENRKNYRILSYIYGAAKTTVAFGGLCKSKTADACVITPAEWRSTYLPTGQLEIAKGISTISGVYRGSRWWLCDSLFDGPSTLGFWSMH